MTNAGERQQPIPTNPWLNHPLNRNPNPVEEASFVEYLRWMRILREKPNDTSERGKKLATQIDLVNNGEVIQLLDKLQEISNYDSRLKTLTDRTRRLATVSFEATASWRVRVGGMRGPASMLLPAFDALGMPYIPSSTLKGVAREMARRDRNVTDDEIREIFGDIEPTACMGKVIFLDAYPLPFPEIDEDSPDEVSGLVPDMANSIWTWDGNNPLYKTNPNVFLSLRKVTFVIGLRIKDSQNLEILNRVQQWLIKGLNQGVGSRVNSGYGVLDVKTQAEQEKPKKRKSILSVKFKLQGQLVHGRQGFKNWAKNSEGTGWKPPGEAKSEVRPPAFRSMLRYWFRTLALGVLEADIVKEWELNVFGGIDPQATLGMFQLELPDGKIIRNNAQDDEEEFGLATGSLILYQSQVVREMQPEEQTALTNLLASLTWLTFHLGGVGQGARRPCYSRQERRNSRPPFWRGSTVKLMSESPENKYWNCPRQLDQFQSLFRSRLNSFYTNLSRLTQLSFDYTQPKTATRSGDWAEAVDSNCRIICVQGDFSYDKPPALALLHQKARIGNGYDSELCGSIRMRSPIWIARVGDRFDVITIFGVDNPIRKAYFDSLMQREYPIKEYQEIWQGRL
ncbi:RAMP superfamily CRISPR-associated protein [Anabaena sp. UHCC 0399]|uniref:RAMP superfamily CRISPR-associated protein n=1 Tax=Anabaena sp. UHCC 0399 TaxID=3110238 RepID=UPI002B1FA7B8|nr:RAMP superfamily CRISPR-associated protein [Anabaena sp. UHCC 0399]MEA5567626.1 RAMP superfamily CRISPR-associated protein [Anabaena sp. UHCC 0399]